MKPPNIKTVNIAKLPTAMEATLVWNTPATSRNIDKDVKCTANKVMSCRKNLQIQKVQLTYKYVSKH